MLKKILTTLLTYSCGVWLFANCQEKEIDQLTPSAEENGETVEAYNTVFVVFKTHLDVGFTDLSSKVEEQYLKNDIPAALKTIEEMRKKYDGRDRYIWTTGTWILSEYLDKASPTDKLKLEKAIADGDIVWHALPYTIESETASLELFEGMLRNAQKLDEKYGKKTLAANMSDVPGHTRSIVSPLHKFGISLLHIGMNRSVNIPQIPVSQDYPDICRWQHPDGSSILFLQKKAYGHDILLPGGNVLSMNVKGDNNGPHTLAQVERIFADLRKTYPDKKVIASNLNDVARLLKRYEDLFPVLTGEIGDTWIHGMGSAPDRAAKVRALSRLYRQWVEHEQLRPDSEEAIRFAIRLGLIAEHTWGADCGKYLQNETPDKYNVEGFRESRLLPEFVFMETSWAEIDEYIPQAVALLPANLRQEALDAIADAAFIPEYLPANHQFTENVLPDGSLDLFPGNNPGILGLFTLQTFNFADFRNWTLTMMASTGAKGGMNGSQAVSASVHPEVKAIRNDTTNGNVRRFTCELILKDTSIDRRLYPEKLFADYTIEPDKRTINLDFTMINKPANRMAEAYWLSFVPEEIVQIVAEKMGSRVDVCEVIEGGNARMMSIDRYIDIVTDKGTFRITSYDVGMTLIGDRKDMSYKIAPDLSKGIHFCLFNNLWGVNYTMWWEGSQRFRFKIELL